MQEFAKRKKGSFLPPKNFRLMLALPSKLDAVAYSMIPRATLACNKPASYHIYFGAEYGKTCEVSQD